MNGHVFQFLISPHDFSVECQAGRSLVSEMDEQMLPVRNRSRAGSAVFTMNLVRSFIDCLLAKDFDVPLNGSGFCIQAQSSQRLFRAEHIAISHRRCQVNPISQHDR